MDEVTKLLNSSTDRSVYGSNKSQYKDTLPAWYRPLNDNDDTVFTKIAVDIEASTLNNDELTKDVSY